ncbi:hypothetical protein WJX75_006898 [Coccomyxa subellipsoidea]|uniref:Rad21/Rec8-like protein N-terminal domain-containing protein n=1 Tax=Coccomyxa subellipsoidea TaxID=248742 RepID=A0ABR2YJP4_9CHLO
MEPDIPQSLRLQGILIGGVVILFNKQQHFLLGKPERITLQDLNYAGADKNIYNVKLLNDALPDDESFQADHAVLGDDLFVMPTLDEPGDSYGDAATNGTNDSSFARGTSAPSLPEIDFDAGLNMKKRRMPAAIMDAPEDLLIDRQVYRDWTVSRTDLVTERPKRQRLQASIAALLEQPALTLPSPLMSLFQKRLIAGPSPTSDKALPSTSPQDSQAAQNPKRMTVPRRPLEDDFFEMQIDQFEAQNEQRPADTDRQGMQEAVPDMPTEEELQAMAEEEGLPIEQLGEHLGTSQPPGLFNSWPPSFTAQPLPRQVHAWTIAHAGPGSCLMRSTSQRSVEYRLSDVREDTSGLGDLSMGGHFDDLLYPLPEENEELPGPGNLTQFQALGGSLMEGPAEALL